MVPELVERSAERRHFEASRTFGLCVLDASFAAALQEPCHRVFALPVKVRNELLCVAWLRSDLRVLYYSSVFPSTPHRFLAGSVLSSLVSTVAGLWGRCSPAWLAASYSAVCSKREAFLRQQGQYQKWLRRPCRECSRELGLSAFTCSSPTWHSLRTSVRQCLQSATGRPVGTDAVPPAPSRAKVMLEVLTGYPLLPPPAACLGAGRQCSPSLRWRPSSRTLQSKIFALLFLARKSLCIVG